MEVKPWMTLDTGGQVVGDRDWTLEVKPWVTLDTGDQVVGERVDVGGQTVDDTGYR